MTINPFKLDVPQATLDDLRDRLVRTRWPPEVVDVDWDYGTDVGYMRELVDYWLHSYDWRKQEAALSAFNQVTAEIDGAPLHCIYERGKGPNPTPIILLHGWPDSVCRYLKLIPLLTDPASHGGDPKHSFDVIVPWLFDSSPNRQKPVRAGLLRQNAERCWRLMTEELGYARFAAAGGDGGSPSAQIMAVDHPESIIGIHLTDIGFHATMANHDNLTDTEQAYLKELQYAGMGEGAYAMMLGTKPQTFAFGLNDSPVGWAALVIEKFRTWSDCDGDLERSFTKDELLTNIMLYWVCDAIDPRGYREEWTNPSLAPNQQIHVPTGVAHPPKDMSPIPPRAFAERNLKNIQRWTILSHGGHFVAMEDPELLAADIAAFFQDLKAREREIGAAPRR